MSGVGERVVCEGGKSRMFMLNKRRVCEGGKKMFVLDEKGL